MIMEPNRVVDGLSMQYCVRNARKGSDKRLHKFYSAYASILRPSLAVIPFYSVLSLLHTQIASAPSDIPHLYEILQTVYTIEYHRVSVLKPNEKIRRLFERAVVELKCLVCLSS